MNPKILLFDIETAPCISFIWGLWQEVNSIDFIEEDWYILCWAAKWLDKKEIMSSSLVDFPKEYKKDKRNDYQVMKKLWKLLDEADIVVAHNGNKFDRKKVNARFISYGMNPPSPYRMVDTLLIARGNFAFTSNKLGDICKFLRIGRKTETGGFKLWKDCLDGCSKAWKKMIKYCKNDVTLLEEVYLKLRPYDKKHPNFGVYVDTNKPCCPKCGSEVYKRGLAYTNVSKFQRYSCKNPKCGAWSRGRVNQLEKDKRKNLITNIS